MRYAVLADVHANAVALEAVLEAVRGVDGILCLMRGISAYDDSPACGK